MPRLLHHQEDPRRLRLRRPERRLCHCRPLGCKRPGNRPQLEPNNQMVQQLLLTFLVKLRLQILLVQPYYLYQELQLL